MMKTPRRRSSDGCLCSTHDFTAKALAVLSTAVITASTEGDCDEKQTAHVRVSNPRVAYCNFFIFHIKNREVT
jgi:hypothetical protein